MLSSITGWSRADLEGKSVLDAGSGSGRFTEIAASLGARVTSIDLSVAAYVTRANVPSENVNVVRGNLLEPPLRRGSFDKVFSIGVLQHTPDPLGVARMLMELVKPGGEVAIWMYEKRWSTPFLPRMVLRRLTRRLPTPAFMPMTKALVSSFSPVARVGSHAPGRRLKGLIRAALPIASYWDSSTTRLRSAARVVVARHARLAHSDVRHASDLLGPGGGVACERMCPPRSASGSRVDGHRQAGRLGRTRRN